MDEQFTEEQWKLAEAPAMEAIREAQGSSQVMMDMLRLWKEMQAIDRKQNDTGERPLSNDP